MQLFDKPVHQTPFYAGFGNRFTDALSYRSVNIPSTRIFTINSNAEVSLDVLELNSYKTGYASMREIVDHFFPPVGLLVPAGGENYTDFNYWRDKPLDIADFTDSEDDDSDTEPASIRSEDEGSEVGEDLEASYLTQDSRDEMGLDDSVVESIEGDECPDAEGEGYLDDEDMEDEEEEEDEERVTPTTELTHRSAALGVLDSPQTPRASPTK
jgi:phosphatidate phosphatase LPIN